MCNCTQLTCQALLLFDACRGCVDLIDRKAYLFDGVRGEQVIGVPVLVSSLYSHAMHWSR